MTQPLSKSEEAAEFLWTVIRERGCVNKEELRHAFVTKFAREWSGRTAITRFYEALRRLEKAGKVYTRDDKICIVDKEIEELKALFCEVSKAIKYVAVSRNNERFSYWVSNGKIVKYIFDKIAQYNIYEEDQQGGLKLRDKLFELFPNIHKTASPGEVKNMVVASAYNEVRKWFEVLKAFISALSSSDLTAVFIDDSVMLAYLIGFFIKMESPACSEFSLRNQFMILTTCRTAADVFLAVRRNETGVGVYVLFPLSGRVVDVNSPYFMTRLPCRVEMDSRTLKWKGEGVFNFGVIDTALDTQRRLAEFFKHIRIVEVEGEGCDFCQVVASAT